VQIQANATRGWSISCLAKINDNAYKIDLPANYGGRNPSNVPDLLPFTGKEASEPRTTPFKGGRGGG